MRKNNFAGTVIIIGGNMRQIVWLVLLTIVPFAVYPDDAMTVGALVEKGGNKLTREQLDTIFAGGITISGVIAQNPRRKSENTFSKDGTFSGSSSEVSGQNGYGLFGTWSISTEGQFCIRNVKTSAGRDASPQPPCTFYFQLGNTYYSATSDDPKALLFVRDIKR
jgi:hypothetical protein